MANSSQTDIQRALALQELGALAYEAGINGPVPKGFIPPWLSTSNYVVENRQMSMYIIDCVFFALAVVMVLMRIYTRVFIIRKFGLDDWLIVLALISVAGFTALQFCFLIYGGVGYHIWDVSNEQLSLCFKFIYFHLIGYTWSITLIKMSILFLYERIIPKTHSMRKVLIAFMVFQIVYFFVVELTFIFQCDPISGALDLQVRLYNSPKCISLKAMLYTFGIIHIFVDLSLLILPIRVIWELQMPVKRKISTLSLFVIGGIGCICAVMRVVTIAELLNGFDFTWTIYEPGMWGLLELTIGIICACIPPSKLLFEQIFAALTGSKTRPFGSSKDSSDSDYKSGGSDYNEKGSRRSPSPGKGFVGSINKSVLMSQSSERIDSVILAREGPVQPIITTRVESPSDDERHHDSFESSRNLTNKNRSLENSPAETRHFHMPIPRTVVIPPSPVATSFGKIATMNELERSFEVDIERGSSAVEERPPSGSSAKSKDSLGDSPVHEMNWI
ncbi:hypothetical protein TWF694_011436 [Orbilia ellipsospora]|uniref:Rhodopsin domain-containing protein n=1 Tax=Orbilia ellipsospora TaxID=2528407 RepID=A0AAV9X7U3_9PEZI